jgi:hypothetical protein
MAVGLSWLIINFPIAFERTRGRSASAPSRPTADAAWCLAGLIALLLIAMACGKAAGPPAALAGFVLLIARCRRQRGEVGLRLPLVTLCCGISWGVFLACWIWGDGYHDPLFRWSILQGHVQKDQLFHVSISNMIRTYGVPSTGLDGVPFVPYHFGSHVLLAWLGELIGSPGIAVYQLVYPVVFLPLLMNAAIVAALALSGGGAAMTASRSLLLWFALLIGLLGILPEERYLGVWFYSDLISESMCTAAIVLLLGLGAGARLKLARGERSREPMSNDWTLAVVGFPAFVAALGFLKVSVAAVFLGASVLICISWRPMRESRAVTVGIALGLVVFIGMSRLVSPALPLRVMRLSYLREFVGPGWRCYYPILELQVLLAAVALRLWQERCRTVEDLLIAWRRGALLDVGFAGFAALVSLLPGFILDLSSAAHYFATVQRWIALPILLGAIISGRRELVAEPPAGLHWTRTPVWKLGALLISVPVALTISVGLLSHSRLMVRNNLWARGLPPRGVPAPEDVLVLRAKIVAALRKGQAGRAVSLIREQTDRQEERRDPRAQTIELLCGLLGLPADEKRVTLLHIPRSNRAYWELLGPISASLDTGSEAPWVTPLVAPALSGLAMLEGLPAPSNIPPGGIYGYGSYLPTDGNARPAGGSREALLRRATEMGFQRVLVLDLGADGAPRLDEWCSAGTRRMLE